MKLVRYHALGNDYLVYDPEPGSESRLDPAVVRRICHRHYGAGSDGILVREGARAPEIALTIYNPDGSIAEKSGNGLRIFARYLWDSKIVGDESFSVSTMGGKVSCRVMDSGRSVTVEMGRVSFRSSEIPVSGQDREVVRETIEVDGEQLVICAATIGNPHCVVISRGASEADAHRFGSLIERHEMFPNRTNVQFLEVLDRSTIKIEIWERGAGYTLASGSSSSAAACVARRLGLVDSEVTVRMPGGDLYIILSEDYRVTMTGPVVRVATVTMDREAFADLSGS